MHSQRGKFQIRHLGSEGSILQGMSLRRLPPDDQASGGSHGWNRLGRGARSVVLKKVPTMFLAGVEKLESSRPSDIAESEENDV